MHPPNTWLDFLQDGVQNYISSLGSLLHIHAPPSIFIQSPFTADARANQGDNHPPDNHSPDITPHRYSSVLIFPGRPAATSAILFADTASLFGSK